MQVFDNRENLKKEGNGQAVLVSYDRQVPEFPVHWHNYMEVLFLISGTLTINVAGSPITMPAGSILFIWPCEVHSVLPNDKPTTIVLQFDPHIMLQFDSFSSRYHVNSHIRLVSSSAQPELFASLSKDLFDLQKAHAEHENGSIRPYYDYYQYRKVCDMMISFFRYEQSIQETAIQGLSARTRNNTLQKIQDACAYISQNFTDSITMAEIAEQVGISKFYFSRIFEEYTGSSFSTYLANCRVRYAKTLLADPDNRIVDVALQSGFGSLASFNRVFSGQEHMTPSEFRKLVTPI